METIIANLNGYLHSLRRLSENKCDFWASTVSINTDFYQTIEDFISKLNTDVKHIETKEVSYSEVEALLEQHLLSKLVTVSDDLKESFAWDIVEYYGLASTASDPEGEFNPLVSNGAIQITVQSGFHKSCVYYIVAISNHAVVTGLAERA
ncbi:hypothetical protein ACUR5C_01590 [Aliikangiella sp. IMCC44653]